MKHLIILVILVGFSNCISAKVNQVSDQKSTIVDVTDPILRHVVIFKWKENTPKDKIAEIEGAFAGLPGKIKEIVDFEWGLNNSPEGLDKGFTHCFFVSFGSEADRAVYLPHPDHQAFVKLIGDHVDDVLVFDYWTK